MKESRHAAARPDVFANAPAEERKAIRTNDLAN